MNDRVLMRHADKSRELGARPLIEYPVSMFRLANAICRYLNLSEPLILSLTLLNIKDAALKRHPNTDPFQSKIDGDRIWKETDLEIDPITVDSIGQPDRAAKRLLDRVWQAFGFEEAPLFDNEGNFKP